MRAHWQISVLLLSIVLGITLACALINLTFESIPTDVSRIGTILRALSGHEEQPQIVIFGDSVVMNGVDARIVQAKLPAGPVVWNLSSAGQRLSESMLYYQNLPSSVNTIVQCIRAEFLRTNEASSETVWNAFCMYGYRPKPETRQALTDCFGQEIPNWLDDSPPLQYFKARWVFRRWIDTRMRHALNSEFLLAGATVDLYHPWPLKKRSTDEMLRVEFRDWAKGRPSIFRASVKALRSTQTARQFAQSLGYRFVVVLNPVHPVRQSYYGSSFPADFCDPLLSG